ncbi:hypothetical protein C8Q72DRAFT_804688 [Fomitopsis betulina]|nr:hypothetical protein C8Q72DRAFT_804688 [Fomitopsis betulina]
MDEFTEWHSIRPWRPTLALSTREITSVSVTFILSSPYSSDSIGSLGMSSDEDADSGVEDECEPGRTQIISDVLAKGLSVKVNGIPWQRVLIRIDEETDEAVIILFGLMPGRQYDVELGIVPGERTLRGQITTDSELHSDPTRSDQHTEEAILFGSSLPSSTSSQGLSISPSQTRRQQLAHELSALNNEHAQLTAALKTARKEAQKADAGLRAEIDTLKRAADRGAAGEQRAKQKVLALREARKQTEAAAEAIEEARKEVEAALPGLEQRVSKVDEELRRVRVRAEEKRREREEAELREKRKHEGWAAEMSALGKTLEKLNVRREKLEGSSDGAIGTIGELEEKLRRLEEERERIERDPFGYEGEAGWRDVDGSQDNEDPIVEPDGHTSRSDHQNAPQAQPQAQILPPIQRPAHNSRLSLPNHRELGAGPGIIHLQASAPVSSHAHKANGRPHANGHTGRAHSNSGSGSASGSSAASSPAPPAIGSNLSGRAQPFEPSGLGFNAARNAQAILVTNRSDLNPGSSPFAPRSAVGQTAYSRPRGGST